MIGVIEFLLSSMIPCYVTFYWEVNKAVIDTAICEDNKQQGSMFDGCKDDDSDSDVEGLSMSAVPLEHILQGSYKDRSVSEFYDAGSNLELLAIPPVDLIGESSTGTSAATVSSNYELVVTVEMSRWDEQGPQQLSDIVAVIIAVDVLPSPTSNPDCSVALHCVRTAEGKMYSMKKLFVVESEDTTEAQTSASRQSVSSVISQSSTSSSPTEAANFSATSSDLHNAVCVVCRELPVTRAFLPCRHACICGLCSRHLRYCPMCRGLIQSYFKMQDEPFIDETDSDASSELRKMSVVEILRGVFTAS